jgi:hypothetical protein
MADDGHFGKKMDHLSDRVGASEDAQHYFLGQTALFLKSLSLLLPFWNSDVTAIDPFVGDSTYRGS